MTTSPDRAATATSADRIEIAERSPVHPDAARLLGAFYRDQVNRYGFAESIDLKECEYIAPNGVFAVVYREGRPVGCGGYHWFDQATSTVEIKKTYLVPALRGQGVGRALLTWLEHHAVAAGAHQAILETGVRNTAALNLFTSAGYRPIERYVAGRDPAVNRAFGRLLMSSPRTSQDELRASA